MVIFIILCAFSYNCNVFFSYKSIQVAEILQKCRARFTKQGKLTRERNSKTALMCVEISACDLLTKRKLKNTDTTSHLHIDQSNTPSTGQISVVANKQSWCLSGAGDLLTTQAQLLTCKWPKMNVKWAKNEGLQDVLIALVLCDSSYLRVPSRPLFSEAY